MKKHTWQGIFVLGIVSIFVFGLNGAVTAQEKIEIPHMNWSTGSVGGSWFPIGSMIADSVNKTYFKGYPITAIPGAGGVGNPKRVAIGDAVVRFGISYAPFLKSAVAGTPPYDKAYPNLKAVCSLITNAFHFVGAKNLEVNTMRDIKERKIPLKVGTGSSGSTELFTIQAIFSELGLSLKDLEGWGGKVEYAATSSRVNLWKDRHIDAWEAFINPPASAVSQVLMARDGNLIGLEKSLRDSLIQKWGYVDFVIPAGTYKGQDKPIETIGLSMVVFARDDVTDQVAYLLAKTVAEIKDKLVKVNAAFKKWEPEMMSKGFGIDVHPGALKYYKERGWR
jgi:TRAP transporter TAXI family solute receptor